MKHVVNFSSGIGSWAAAKRVAEKYGTENLVLLFANTNSEDPDNYRFLRDAAANVGGEVVMLNNGGKSVWDVFHEDSYIGNPRGCNAANTLKRAALDAWTSTHLTPETATIYVGFDWTEPERLPRLREILAPWSVEAPMAEPPLLTKSQVLEWARREGVEPPRMYALGYPHANCGDDGCIQGGMGYWEHRLTVDPPGFRRSETLEGDFRILLWAKRVARWINNWRAWGYYSWDGPDVTKMDVLEACALAGIEPGEVDVAILRDRSGGKTRPLTLRTFRERIEAGQAPTLDLFANDDCGGTCMWPELKRAS